VGRRTIKNNPGLGFITAALAAATALVPLAIPLVSNIFGKKEEDAKFNLAPSTYAQNYQAMVQAKAAEAIAAEQTRQAEVVASAQRSSLVRWIVIGGIGVFVIGGALYMMKGGKKGRKRE
jgi:hypothetical protein